MKNKIDVVYDELRKSWHNTYTQIVNLKNTFLCTLISAIENVAGPGHYIRLDCVLDSVFKYEDNDAEIIGVKIYANEIYLLEEELGWLPLSDFEYYDELDTDTIIRYFFDSNNLIVRCDDSDTNTQEHTDNNILYVVTVVENDKCFVNSVYKNRNDAAICIEKIAESYAHYKKLKATETNKDFIVLCNDKADYNVKISIDEVLMY